MTPPPVDTAVLNELRSIMADDFQMLLDVFISDSEQRIVMIEKAIANNDAEGLRDAAHSFKGSSLNISAAQLTEYCRQLEFMGRDNDMAEAESVFVETKKAFAIVREYLTNL